MEIHAVTHCITLSSEELDIIKDTIALRIDEIESIEDPIESIEDPEERKKVEKSTSYLLLTKIHAAMCLYLDE